MKTRILLLFFLGAYLAVIFPFTSYMKNKPFLEKVGYTPSPDVLKFLSADQHGFAAASIILKVVIYYGGLVEQARKKVSITPEYPQMQHAIGTAVKLDPYNMDAYYFDQAIMVWGAGQVEATNELLEYGMNYRTWDFFLPYFAGFNYAYFLKDYTNAAKYYKQVADLTGDSFIMSLSSRYMYESGRTDTAIDYLSLMLKGASNEAIRTSLGTRLLAFERVRAIELAFDGFNRRFRRHPRSVEELVQKGYLKKVPIDPYGGEFYIDKEGKVGSTSKFAFGVVGRTR